MASALGPNRCVTLPMFHAFTGVMFWKQGQTDCMWTPEWRSHTSFLCFGCYPGDHRWLAVSTGTIASLTVRLYKQPGICQWERKQFTQKCRAIVLRHKQYLCRTQSAPSRWLLGRDDDCDFGAPISKWMGGGTGATNMLDNTLWSDTSLSWTTALWLQ